MIQFDNQGYLKPASPIEISLKTLKEIFTFNDHRQQLFEQYISYLTELKSIIDTPFEQWIDAYYICKYPENHSRFAETNGDYFYWLNQFTKDRRKNSKGFIKIIIGNE